MIIIILRFKENTKEAEVHQIRKSFFVDQEFSVMILSMLKSQFSGGI